MILDQIVLGVVFAVCVAFLLWLAFVLLLKASRVCKHHSACAPVSDWTGWVIGEYCTKCMKFWPRRGMPSYEERMRLIMARGRR